MAIKKYTKEQLEKMENLTDYKRLENMTEEEIIENAKSDPDVPLLTDDELKRFKKVTRTRGAKDEDHKN